MSDFFINKTGKKLIEESVKDILYSPPANPNDTYVTKDMVDAGNKMADVLYDACVLKGASGKEHRRFYERVESTGNVDLVKRYAAGDIDSVTGIYLAMERARK